MKEAVIGAKRMEKKCAHCGKRFITNHAGVKYCSEKCYKEKLRAYEAGRKKARRKYYNEPRVRERMRAHWRRYKREKYAAEEGRKKTPESQRRGRRKR